VTEKQGEGKKGLGFKHPLSEHTPMT
jgi:hypothetical protein